MSDWIGLGFILALLCAVLAFAAYAGRPPRPISEEEFERRVREGTGLAGSGMLGLQRLLQPEVDRAIAVQQDLKAGHYEEEQQSGDTNDTEPGGTETQRSEGTDA